MPSLLKTLENAVTAPSQLTNTLLSLSFSEDEQLVVSGLRPRSILAQQVELPAGFEAVAVDVRAVAGGAGYVTPGDRVNVYLVTLKCAADNAIPGPSGEEVIQTAVPTSRAVQNHRKVGHGSRAAGANRRAATGEYRNAPRPPVVSRYGSEMGLTQYASASNPNVLATGAMTTKR